ncbi:Auxin-induced protein 5NG4 [Hordeum vulgare]|nr:Auxin-induced protein 5NG4 [Hordeum vulgare]
MLGLHPPPGGLAGDAPNRGTALKSSYPPTGLVVNFTNRFDVYYVSSKVFWCGCEFIAFTTYNILMDVESLFLTSNDMHGLPYYLGENDMEERSEEEAQVKMVAKAIPSLLKLVLP